MELKQRAQMDPAYQWDLTAIYENDAAWERAMEKAAEAVKELKGLPGTLGASAQALADGLDKIYAASALVERAYICHAAPRRRQRRCPRAGDERKIHNAVCRIFHQYCIFGAGDSRD